MKLFRKTEGGERSLQRLRGIIAYHAGATREAFDLLSALPVEKRLKDFSALGATDLAAKLSVFESVPAFPVERLQTLAGRSPGLGDYLEVQRLFRGFFHDRDGLFFVNNFPAHVEEAEALEARGGGPNLFVNFVGAGEAPRGQALLGCARCGRTEKSAALPPLQLRRFGPDCVEGGACELQALPEPPASVAEALTRFYEERGLALTFELRPGVDQRRELLERLLVAVKY